MSINLKRFLNTVNSLNESIENLIGEGVVITPPSGVRKTKQIFTVIADGSTPPNDGKEYIELKEAKDHKIDAVVGDEIEIQVLTFEDMDDNAVQEKLTELFNKGDISFTDLKQMVLTGFSGKVRRTAMGLLKVGPKVIMAAGRLAALQGIKKTVPHSSCFCAKLFDDNVNTATKEAERSIYLDELNSYIDVVRDQFLESWDDCESRFGELMKNEDKRSDTIAACVTIEDWYTDAESVLQQVMNKLGKYYNITGIDVKKTKLKGGDVSVAKSIAASGSRIRLHFEDDLPKHNGSGNYYVRGADQWFVIQTYKEAGNTVWLKDGSISLFFEFQTNKKNKTQTGSVWKEAGGSPDSSTVVKWKGDIVAYDN